ncbi:MAG TPA: hypothetical protein VF718_05790 [Allosphingosinicella sp.]|jgi:hypothetical protein
MTQIEKSNEFDPAKGSPMPQAQGSDAQPMSSLVVPGPADAHGHPVHSFKEPKPKNAQFKPEFLCVVYLRFEANQLLTARYGYVKETDLLNPEKVVTAANSALHALHGNNTAAFHQGKIYYDLDFISAGCQLIMILFLNNDPDYVKFEHINGPDYIVRFSKLSAVQPDNPTFPVQENNAFFNLMKLTISGLTGQEAYRIDYWDTELVKGEVSDPAPEETGKYRRYSMNIHLRMAIATPDLKRSTHWVPLVIDPDTGNMGGDP